METTLIFSCLHLPYTHPHAVDFLAETKRKYRPKVIVNLGDEIDAHALSRFTHDPDLPSAGHEIHWARTQLKSLYHLFPVVRCCVSNHTWRAYVRAKSAGIPTDFLRPISEVLGAPKGWVWQSEWLLNGTLFIHGEGFGGRAPALTAAERLRANVAIGHVHTAAGVYYSYGPRDRLFGMSVGCLINETHPAFEYARTNALRPALGCGVIVEGIPIYVPMYV